MRRVALIVLVCIGLVSAVVGTSLAEDGYRDALLVEQITVGSQEGRHPKFDFNDDRPYVCSMNQHIPAVQGKWHNLVDRLDAEMLLDQVVFEWFGSEKQSMLAFRKHSSWYTKGFSSSAALRDRLMRVKTLDELDDALVSIDRTEHFPVNAHLMRRGKRQGTQKVVLPAGFLDDLEDATPPEDDGSEAFSGG